MPLREPQSPTATAGQAAFEDDPARRAVKCLLTKRELMVSYPVPCVLSMYIRGQARSRFPRLGASVVSAGGLLLPENVVGHDFSLFDMPAGRAGIYGLCLLLICELRGSGHHHVGLPDLEAVERLHVRVLAMRLL